MIKIVFFLLLAATSAFASDPKSLLSPWDTSDVKGSVVTLGAWGGSESINKWIDSWAAPRLKEKYGITLKRFPLGDTALAVKRLLSEKKAGAKKGGLDLVWVNGENFKTLKEENLLWGPFLYELPHFKKLDSKDLGLFQDFGVSHNGLEMPWGSAEFVFIYRSDKIKNPPKSFKEVKAWAKKNPGRFTYPSPPDFTGSAFTRLVFHDLFPKEYAILSQSLDKDLYSKVSKSVWKELKEISPFLWRKGKAYPKSSAALHQLFSDGKVWMSMGYYPTVAEQMIRKGSFPKTAKTFVFKNGTLANTHFLAIPFNAPRKKAAAIVANFFLSPKAQASKLNPSNWGDFPVLDQRKLTKKEQKIFESIDLGASTLSLKELGDAKRFELPSGHVPLIEKDWKKFVLKRK